MDDCLSHRTYRPVAALASLSFPFFPSCVNEAVVLFSQDELTDNQELIQTYRLHIAQDINQDNLALFCGSYQ